MSTKYDLTKIHKQEALEFMGRFSVDVEELEFMASTNWGSHVHRVLAKIAVYGSDQQTYDFTQLYIQERIADPNKVDGADLERAAINAANYINAFVPPDAANLCEALRMFMNEGNS